MAGLSNMKFWYVTVYEKIVDPDGKIKMKELFHRKCMNVDEANQLFKEKKETHVGPQFTVMRENY